MFTNFFLSNQTFELFLGNLSFLLLFLAMISFWFQTAFSGYLFPWQSNNLAGFPGNQITTNKNLFDEKQDTKQKKVFSVRTKQNTEQIDQGRKQLSLHAKNKDEDNSFSPTLLNDNTAPTTKPNESMENATTNSFFSLENFANFCILMTNFCLLTLLVLRWISSGHFPLSNLYESLIFLCWCCTSIHILIYVTLNYSFFNLLDSNNRLRKSGLKFDQLLGCILSPCALFINAYATFSLPKQMQSAAPLVPALKSNWLMMHVTVMILSYSALILGSLLAICFLIVTFKKSDSAGNFNEPIADLQVVGVQKGLLSSNVQNHFINKTSFLFGYANNQSDPIQSQLGQGSFAKETSFGLGSLLEKQLTHRGNWLVNSEKLCLKKTSEVEVELVNHPSQSYLIRSVNKKQPKEAALVLSKNLDNLSYRILGIGFPFLTIGILSGAVWANEAWGSYWSWDPKETWALLTWLVFAMYLHMRLSYGWQGKKPALIASLGFLTVWFCFLGVNLLADGLHSYGWVLN